MSRTLAGRQVQPIDLGSMNLSSTHGTPPPREDAVRLLNEALDRGYDHLDATNLYGTGANEELLAEAVMCRRDEFLLASKTGIVVDGPRRGIDCSPTAIATSLDASLKRLGTDRIDLFYMYRFRSEGADFRQRRCDGAGDRSRQDRRLRRVRMVGRAYPQGARGSSVGPSYARS